MPTYLDAFNNTGECGAPSRWRWAEPCRRPSCFRCYGRFVERELAKTVAHFERHDPQQLGWLAIRLDVPGDVAKLTTRATNRLRNTVDRERRRRSAWDDVEVRMLFGSEDQEPALTGFVYFGDVAPSEFVRVLTEMWSIEAVRVEPFSQGSAEVGIRAFGARWRDRPQTTHSSFRRMRLTVGPRWTKATRHWSPVTSGPAYVEPMPVSFGLDGTWL